MRYVLGLLGNLVGLLLGFLIAVLWHGVTGMGYIHPASLVIMGWLAGTLGVLAFIAWDKVGK